MSLKYTLCITAALSFTLPLQALAQSGASELASPTTATSPATASSPTAAKPAPNSPVTHVEFESLLHDTLMNNPEILMDVVKRLHDKHTEEASKQMQESLAKHKEELAHDTTSPSVGSKSADIVITEFFDYHCGFCKHMLPVVAQMLHDDKKVRFVFREFPILAEDSVAASRAAIAVYRIAPDKYFDFHTELMHSSGKFDDQSLTDIAKKVGVDAKKMKKEMENPEITKMLDDTRALAEDMGIRGTPALIVGDNVVPGAMNYDELAKMVADVRKGIKPDGKMTAPSNPEPAPAKPAKEEKEKAKKPADETKDKEEDDNN